MLQLQIALLQLVMRSQGSWRTHDQVEEEEELCTMPGATARARVPPGDGGGSCQWLSFAEQQRQHWAQLLAEAPSSNPDLPGHPLEISLFHFSHCKVSGKQSRAL